MDQVGDISSASVNLLDSSGAVVNKLNPMPANFGTSPAVNISLSGFNRVRVSENGKRSNLLVFSH
jgi:hypothetical protein